MQHVLVSREFGYPIYVERCADRIGNITDRIEDAEVFDDAENNLALKEAYWTALAGYSFEAEPIQQHMAAL